MTALSANRAIDSRNEGPKIGYAVAASTTIYAGSLVMIDEDGYARPAAARSGSRGCVGVAVAKADNASGSAGDINVQVEAGEFKFAGTTLLQEHVGLPVYAEDDQTVDGVRGNIEPLAGRLVEYVSATVGWIKVGPEFYEAGGAAEQGKSRVRYFDDFVGNDVNANWTTHDTSAAGSPTLATVADSPDGAYRLEHAANDEVENIALYWGDKTIIDPTKNPQFHCRLQLEDSLNANDILVFGLADARNATLDSNASHAWFRVEAGLDILLESDDGTTDNDDKDPSVAVTVDTYYEFLIDVDDRTDVKFYYRANGDSAWTAMTVSGVTFSVGTALLQPYFELQKSGGTQTSGVLIDWVEVSWDRT